MSRITPGFGVMPISFERPARTGLERLLASPLRPVRPREYQLLTDAHRARKGGQTRAAIRLYRRTLLENPRNLEVALRVAPMLACAGERFEAWQLYRRVAMDAARARRFSDCLTIYREACRFVPHEFEAWRLCAELQLKLKNPDGAFETLIEGRMHFNATNERGQAIALLSRAREIEPWDDEVLLDLAALYAATDQPDLALELLTTLSCRVGGSRLRRVRSLQLRLTWAPRYAWLWLRAFGAGPPPEPASPISPEVEFLNPFTLEVLEAEPAPHLRSVSAH